MIFQVERDLASRTLTTGKAISFLILQRHTVALSQVCVQFCVTVYVCICPSDLCNKTLQYSFQFCNNFFSHYVENRKIKDHCVEI
jgi:hypothetical protein